MEKKLTLSQVKSLQKKLKDGQEVEIKLMPSKCRLDSVWFSGHIMFLTKDTEVDKMVNSFAYYNCNSELGNRVHFYQVSNIK